MQNLKYNQLGMISSLLTTVIWIHLVRDNFLQGSESEMKG